MKMIKLNRTPRARAVLAASSCLVVLISAALTTSGGQAAFVGKNGLIYFTGALIGAKSDEGSLWALNPATQKYRPVPQPEGSFPPFTPSPDGRHIAFISGHGEESGLSEMDADGTNVHPILSTIEGFCVAFTPSGKRIVYIGRNGLWKVDINGTHRHRLFRGYASCPAVAPDGKIAYLRSIYYRDGHEGTAFVIIHANGSDHRVIFRTRAHDFWPEFSPDGRHIAFTGDSPEQNVSVINSNGTNLRHLTNHLGLDECPVYSPDGHEIAYRQLTTTRPRYGQVWVMRANGSHKHRLTPTSLNVFCPQWAASTH